MLKGATCIWGIERYIFLNEMMTCESNLKETKGIHHVGVWGKMMSGRERTACAKVLGQEQTGLLEEVTVCTGLHLTLTLLLPKTELSGSGWEL